MYLVIRSVGNCLQTPTCKFMVSAKETLQIFTENHSLLIFLEATCLMLINFCVLMYTNDTYFFIICKYFLSPSPFYHHAQHSQSTKLLMLTSSLALQFSLNFHFQLFIAIDVLPNTMLGNAE